MRTEFESNNVEITLSNGKIIPLFPCLALNSNANIHGLMKRSSRRYQPQFIPIMGECIGKNLPTYVTVFGVRLHAEKVGPSMGLDKRCRQFKGRFNTEDGITRQFFLSIERHGYDYHVKGSLTRSSGWHNGMRPFWSFDEL